ncbi:ABC transporter substrate-binding protein [Methanoplanus endosymbiosus]|uniref:Penicillin-binding protein activator n=1 Tax=Methanoplanus endosymbiosus TaxID=33865 RepID=A0A9E7PM36_9EURY|nr:penicillin-binding protein activator [Methanoplanus endosymbiosus]UUX91361.1 penicillin-binding protein activator [Methanoplanus endosymbiosus]
MRVINYFVLFVIVTAMIFMAGCTSEAASTQDKVPAIKIGVMCPYTGDLSPYGQAVRNGVNLAFEKANPENVELVYEDSAGSVKAAMDGIRNLVQEEDVQAVIGDITSGSTLTAAPFANKYHVTLISASSTSPDITDSGDYIFRTIPSDDQQGRFASELIYTEGHHNLALIFTNNGYGVGLTKVVRESYADLGGRIVADESVDAGSSDVSALVSKLKAVNPDAVYLISNSPEITALVLNEIAVQGIDTRLYGSEGLMGQTTLDIGKPAEGLTITAVSSGTPEFAQEYEAAYGEGPGPFSAQGYDAALALFKVIQEGALTKEEIKTALYSVELDGVTGKVSFDENGNIDGGYIASTVKNGQFIEAI